MKTLQDLSAPLGRIFLALIFILSGFNKIGGYEGTAQYMASAGVPGSLLPLVILAELGLGLLVAFGLFTRLAALGLAVFTLLAAVLFHGNIGDQSQFIQFMKNLSITGGFLVLWVHGPGAYALDNLAGIGRISDVPRTQ